MKRDVKFKLEKPVIRFGTDGWRGVIGRDFTFANVRLAAHATAQTFQTPARKTVYVGYDHRFQADAFAAEVAGVLSRYRFDARLCDSPVTSPLLSFITWKNRAPFGVMLTASHNPAEYLGFKVKGSFGGSIPQQAAMEIEKGLDRILAGQAALAEGNGKTFRPAPVPLKDYYAYLAKIIDLSLFRKSRAPITYDFLYGPGAKIAQGFFRSFPNQIRFRWLHDGRDALFGGLHPEPIDQYLSELKREARRSRPIACFALDGDADRLGAVDERGNYLTPQQVFSLLLYYLAETKGLRGKVVQAVSLGYVSERIARDFGLPFEEVPVGFKYVAERLVSEDVLLGGEESGGYAFSKSSPKTPPHSILPERDGLLCSLLFTEMLLATGKSVSALLGELSRRYGPACFLRNDLALSKPADKAEFVRRMQNAMPSRWMGFKIREMRTEDGLKIVLEDGSWLLMRPSGTEPLLRTYGEFPSRALIARSLGALEELVRGVLR